MLKNTTVHMEKKKKTEQHGNLMNYVLNFTILVFNLL